jgi:hypothetical protein
MVEDCYIWREWWIESEESESDFTGLGETEEAVWGWRVGGFVVD